MHRLEENPKLGVYYLGQHKRPLYNKLQALELSSKLNAPLSWDFNSSVYDQVNWTHEPEIDLDTLYFMRARQLRERYDYLILNYSGGADSTNILYSFLKNGLHIDEIVVRHPESALRNVAITDKNTSVQNTISEFDYAVKPRLEWVRNNFPNVKITIHDYFESMVNSNLDESWIYDAREFFHPGMLTRFNNLSFKEQLELYDRGRTTAVIYGIDKPKLFYIDGKYVVYFVDIVANTAVSDVDDYTNITTEFFYWTPDLPEITVKQAHLLRKWYDLNPQQRYIIDPKENVTGDLLAHLERSIIVPVIYPSVDHNMFQASKPTQAIFSEHDSWFWDNHMNTQMAQVWEAGVKTLLKTVPNSLRYTPEGKVAGLQLFKSKFYYL